MRLKDGTDYELPPELRAELAKTYRNLDVDREISKMALWCEANRAKRKTRRGVLKFIIGWLNKAQPEIAKTLPKCVRCAMRHAMQTHNGQGYCTPCLAVIVGPVSSEPRSIGSLLDNLLKAGAA